MLIIIHRTVEVNRMGEWFSPARFGRGERRQLPSGRSRQLSGAALPGRRERLVRGKKSWSLNAFRGSLPGFVGPGAVVPLGNQDLSLAT